MFNYFLYRLGQAIALRVPVRAGYAIAQTISDLRYLVASQDKREVLKNLKAIFPEKNEKEILSLRLSMFRNFAKYLVDFFRFSAIDKCYIDKHVTLENIQYLDEALAKNKGVVVLTAHLGNWELGGIILALLGYPFWAVALSHKNKKVNAFFIRQRESKGVKVIPFHNAVRQCLNVLKNKGAIALLGDRDFTKEGGILVDFFGKKTSLPKGPAAFSLRTGAPIVAGFMIRNPDNSFTLTFEKPLMPPSKAFDHLNTIDNESLLEMTIAVKDILEKYIKKFPEQWYMFRQFWL